MLSRKAAAIVRRTLARQAFTHTYTRTPRVAGSEDPYGNVQYTDGTPVLLEPCRYSPIEQLYLTAEGRIVLSRPALIIPWDDPLLVGDKVSAIVDRDGTILLAGPLRVDTIEPDAVYGRTLAKRAMLLAGQVEG